MKIFVTYVAIDKVFGIVRHESSEFADKFFAIEKDEKVHGIPFERLKDSGVGEYGSAVNFAQCHQDEYESHEGIKNGPGDACWQAMMIFPWPAK